ncbi:MAG: LamG-like jellyroll fold domain-containing protein [Bacteroidota bacterium]
MLGVVYSTPTLLNAQFDGGDGDGYGKDFHEFIFLDGTSPSISTPTITDQINCGMSVANLNATTGTGGTTCRWYNSKNGGTLLNTGTSYTTPSLSDSTIYYVSSYNSSTLLESKRVALTVFVVYADAGADINTSSSSYVLEANDPTGSAGTWSVISGTGTFDNANDPNTNVSSLSDGLNTFRWTLSGCDEGSSYDEVNITYVAPYNIFAGGNGDGYNADFLNFSMLDGGVPPISDPIVSDFINCDPGTPILNAAPGSGGTTCRWYDSALGGSLLQTGTSFTTPLLNTTEKYYVTSYDGVSLESERIEVQAIIAIANAGDNQNLLISNSTTMTANNPTGTGTWTLISGSGSIGDANNPATSITNLPEGSSVFRWTLNNCDGGSSYDEVTLTYVSPYDIFYGGNSDGNARSFSYGHHLDGTGRPGSGMTFVLDGSDDDLTINHQSTLDLTDGTIEFWVSPNWTASSNGYNPTVLAKSGSGFYAYSVKLLDDLSGIGLYNQSTLATVAYTFLQGNWYHVAIVENGSNAEVFINGISQGMTGMGFDTATGHPLYVGSDEGSDYFTGMIDELRIWSTSLSQDEIRDYMCRKVTNSHPQYASLEGYWKFDEGWGISVIDETNSFSGLLNIYPEWNTSGASLGDQSSHAYSSPASHSFNPTDAGTLYVTLNTGAFDGIQIYYVNQDPNDTNPPGTLAILDNKYFGVYGIGSSYSYDMVYDYTGNANINEETSLNMAHRNNNADNWIELNGTLNTSANTISKSNLSGTEYILAATSFSALPVTLVSFTADPVKDGVKLKWVTASEINNDHFEIEMSEGNEFIQIGKVPGNGNTDELMFYEFIDHEMHPDDTYYRLKQVDFDGHFEYSKVIQVLGVLQDEINFYPNPSTERIYVRIPCNDKSAAFKLLGLQGHIYNEGKLLTSHSQPGYIDLSNVKPGTYLLMIYCNDFMHNEKIVVLR